MKELVIRTISGIAFIVIMVTAILCGPLSYTLLFSAIIAVMINEYINITCGKNLTVHKLLAVTSGILLFTISVLVVSGKAAGIYLTISAIPIFAFFIINLYRKEFNIHKYRENGERENNGYELFPFAVTSVVYIALPFSICNMALFSHSADGNIIYSPQTLLLMFILLWANDVGAYCVGSSLGQKYGGKLFPSISPKKSWMGFFGGLASCLIIAFISGFIPFFEISWTKSVVLATIICIFGVWGDLAESQLKRNYGVKDSGKIMPGHGGMLDRFDAALIAFPAAALALQLLA